ncbi:hypothetical protein C1Y40_05632 [Mycobacterium talmoniae]|uniref:DUF4226 domain-containing protein n=1 Tax=Mycobacterium talmoniae TaxID=1858794 RepID=A0A2S8BC26_9MYCO|nr:hypothetical protein C1Y40_05632 [Mycobacterium talmoniae]
MPQQIGPSAAALEALRAALATQRASAAQADRVLTDVLAAVHAAAVAGAQRLDAVAAEIDAGVANPTGFAADTALGAREFQKFLIAKQREILAVVTEAHQFDATQRDRVEALRAAYSATGGG